ncbi:AraC family transcriptional regulator [Tistrella bauzanensis]|uniref:AraC family transcriptional regulator n=1 Tax=Tistrella bauzanensis TaxID=657419 RepID=A0ABQ1IJN4_9PROT|nr:AraC family transcriptional regulator [Tistrella bauzanensis]GGB43906.1 AraC family transcriptional regulator [Tistrella bauzanensis]
MTLDDLSRKVLAYADARDIGDEPSTTDVPGLKVSRRIQATELVPVLYEPIFCLVLEGAKQARQGSRIIDFPRGHSVVVGIDLPTDARVVEASPERPYVALALKLDMGLIRELSAEPGFAGGAGGEVAAISVAEADDAIIAAMGRLFALMDKPAALPVLHPLLIREIHYWLLCANHGSLLRALTQAGSNASRIADAIVIIRSNFERPLVVADLASAVGMSVSAFHLQFKAVTGTTPLQYQKRLRLIEAKRLMQSERQSVSSAAFSVGYESPTQFSREYVRMFGLPPARHARVPARAHASNYEDPRWM